MSGAGEIPNVDWLLEPEWNTKGEHISTHAQKPGITRQLKCQRHENLNQEGRRRNQHNNIDVLPRQALTARLEKEKLEILNLHENERRTQLFLRKQQTEVALINTLQELKQLEEERRQKLRLRAKLEEIERLRRELELKRQEEKDLQRLVLLGLQDDIEQLELENESTRQLNDELHDIFLYLALQEEIESQNDVQQVHNKESKALELLCSISGNNPSDNIEDSLTFAKFVESGSPTYNKILEYINNSQEHGFKLKVTNIIRIVRKNEHDLDIKNGSQRNRMMLWHGTKKQFVGPIINEGFKRPTHRGMFGNGIYFADRFSKSVQYCDADKRKGALGYLFLCHVELGKIHEALRPGNGLTNAPNNYNSVKGVGKNIPDLRYDNHIEDSLIACGPSVTNLEFRKYPLNFNEYVVYQPERANPRFLVIVEYL